MFEHVYIDVHVLVDVDGFSKHVKLPYIPANNQQAYQQRSEAHSKTIHDLCENDFRRFSLREPMKLELWVSHHHRVMVRIGLGYS
jgi:hypothetical protein